MKNKIIILISLFVAGLGATINAQNLKAWQKAADEAFERKDYYSAYQFYNIALEFDSTNIRNRFNLAESARLYGSYHKADSAYQVLFEKDVNKNYPFAYYWNGEVNRYLGKYKLAKKYYQKFLKLNKKEKGLIVRKAKLAVENCDWALSMLGKVPTDTIRHAGELINSQYSDFAATLHGDSLYFSSFRFVFEKDTLDPPRPFIKIMKTVNNEEPEVLDDRFNLPTKHVAHTAFNLEYSTVYYTVCDYEKPTEIRCDLYQRDKLFDGTWGEPTMLAINSKRYTSTQPNVGYDSTAQETRLYFVSNRPSTNKNSSNLDIWYSKINEDGSLEEPVNFKEVNTPFDEATPFFHTATQKFYFSSEAYQNLGGFDIFYTKREEDGNWPTTRSSKVNLGIPINSSYNDLYYSTYWNGARTYFSSNRPDSLAIFWDESKDACCNDIYYIDNDITIDLLVRTFNLLDRSPLDSVQLTLVEITPNGEIPILTVENPNNNTFQIDIIPNRNYILRSSREDFIISLDTINMKLPKLHHSLKVERELYLAPATAPIVLNAFSFNLIDGVPLDQTSITLFEVTPSSLKPIAEQTAKLGQNDFHFPLLPNKQYLIEVERDGYTAATATVMPIAPKTGDPILIDRNLFLLPPNAPTLALQVRTFESDLTRPLNGVNVDLFEWTPIGLKFVSSKIDPETNESRFDVLPNKKYVIKGLRPAYTGAQDTLIIANSALVPNGIVNAELVMLPPVIEQIQLDVLTYDTDFTNPLAGATVELWELTSNGPKLMARVENPTGNDFSFPILPAKKYQLKATRDNYTTAEQIIDASNPNFQIIDGKLSAELLLLPPDIERLKLEAATYDTDFTNPLAGTRVELWKLTPNGPKLMARVENPTGNGFNFPILPGGKYELKATRDTYTTAQQIIDTSNPNIQIVDGVIKADLLLLPPNVETLALEALTFDTDISHPLGGTTVELWEMTPFGPRLIASMDNPVGNDFNFPIIPGRKYELRATHDSYLAAQQTIDTSSPNMMVVDGKVSANLLLLPPYIQKLRLEAKTYDTDLTNPLQETKVNLYEIRLRGPVLIATAENPEGNDYEFSLIPGKKYQVKGIRDGYMSATQNIDATQLILLPSNGVMKADLFLIPPTIETLRLEVLTFDTEVANPLIGTNVELYELTPNGLVLKAVRENPVGNNYSFPILPNKMYQLQASRDGYITAQQTLDTHKPDLSVKGLVKANLILLPPPIESLKLDALTFENELVNPLPGTTVELYELTPKGLVLQATRENPAGNDYNFNLIPGKVYKVIGKKSDFKKAEQIIDTRNPNLVPKSGVIKSDLLLARPSIQTIELEALTFDTKLKPLDGATVQLYEIRPTGLVLVAKTKKNVGNDYNFLLVPGRKYEVVAERKGFIYDQATIDVSLPNLIPSSGKMKVDLKLDQLVELNALTFDYSINRPLQGTVVELWEMTPLGPKWTARIENPTGNDFNFSVLPRKKYQLIATKDGYTTAQQMIDLANPNLLPKNGNMRVDLVLNQPAPPLALKALTFNNNNSNPLNGAIVQLLEVEPTGLKLVAEFENPTGNDHTFSLLPGKKYRVKGMKKGFTEVELSVDLTKPENYNVPLLERKLIFTRPIGQMPLLEIFTYKKDTINPLPGVNIELIKYLNDQPILQEFQINVENNNYIFPITLDQKYIISATKPGFEPFMDTLTFTQLHLDPITNKIPMTLKLNPYSLDDFLPLALYFDNDRPDSRTYRKTSTKTYPESFEQYYNRREEFIATFVKDMDRETAFVRTERLRNFFERDVKNGNEDLLSFTDQLIKILEGGISITIQIKGYSSPRGNTKYNDNLSERRIDSVINHFEAHRKGVIAKYLKNKQLVIEKIPLGEKTVKTKEDGIADDNSKNSIYTKLASLERRVEIIEVKAQ